MSITFANQSILSHFTWILLHPHPLHWQPAQFTKPPVSVSLYAAKCWTDSFIEQAKENTLRTDIDKIEIEGPMPICRPMDAGGCGVGGGKDGEYTGALQPMTLMKQEAWPALSASRGSTEAEGKSTRFMTASEITRQRSNEMLLLTKAISQLQHMGRGSVLKYSCCSFTGCTLCSIIHKKMDEIEGVHFIDNNIKNGWNRLSISLITGSLCQLSKGGRMGRVFPEDTLHHEQKCIVLFDKYVPSQAVLKIT